MSKEKTKGTSVAANVNKVEWDEAKKKSIEIAMKSLDKQFGKGTIIRMGDKVIEDLEVISTGSLGIDKILGVGGIPKGRMIEIYGPESSGKCLTADSYILTKNGLKTVKEILEEINEKDYSTQKYIEMNIPLVNKLNNIENTSHITMNGARKVYKIKTKSGFEIKTTANHPHLKMNNNGFNKWEETKNLKINDYLAFSRYNSSFGETNLPFEEAYLLGCLIADGSLQKNRISFSNDDEYVKNIFKNNFKILGFSSYKTVEMKKNKSNDRIHEEYHINSKEEVNNFYNKYELNCGNANTKNISKYIRSFNKETLKAFISGFIECEGFFDGISGIDISSSSKELLFQLKLILQQFGIISSLNIKKAKNYPDNEYFRLNLSGQDMQMYMNEIGIKSHDRIQQYNRNNYDRKQLQSNIDSIPFQGQNLEILYSFMEENKNQENNKLFYAYIGKDPKANLTYGMLKRMFPLFPKENILTKHFEELNELNYFYDKIISIELIDEKIPTFDFVMPITHSFIANGFVTHNTTLTLQIAAECQKKGGIVAFVDAEHALDIKYAKNLGVDIENLLVSQPDYGEAALTIVEELANSGAVDVIIVDSVAALTPKSEIEGEMGDAQMGVQARLMSQALRKLTGVVSKNKCTVIFINQLRQKIGNVGYGQNDVTTGGNALKFYATIRIDIRKISTVKEGENSVANTVKVKITKNKVAPPFQQCEVNIYFGEGFSLFAECADLGIKYELIDKAGAWLTYGESIRTQGKPAFIKKLKEDKPAFEKLKGEIVKRIKEDSTVLAGLEDSEEEEGE